MAQSIPIAARSSTGLTFYQGPPDFNECPNWPAVSTKSCKLMLFSSDGTYFAYVNGPTLTIVDCDKLEVLGSIQSNKTYGLAFSPKGTFLMTWEPFTVSKDNPQGSPNLHIYKTENGELVKSFVHKKQSNWEPQWSADEKLFVRMMNTDVVFCEDLNFDRIVARINCHKVASYKISPNVGTYFIVCHTPSPPGQPSFGRLFKYPNFEGQQAIANKSFFQADKVDFYWNPKGTCCLLLTSTEVDKTGGSYYGKQGLHFMGLNGSTSMVVLSKDGPIYSLAWSPKSQEFCVVYGFVPAKATIFNLKCEPVFDLGTGPRNAIYYNPQGNILLLGGFGNLRGQIETWDVVAKKKIGDCDAPDTTLLEWAADGVHFLTATTTPRLRISNGFKIWHYSGSLLWEKMAAQSEELYDVTWRKYPKNTYPDPVISEEKVKGIASSQPTASKQAYRPPSARGLPMKTFKLDDDEDATKPKEKGPSKQKKKRDAAKKAKKAAEASGAAPAEPQFESKIQINLTGDPEVDKKMRNIKKKLDAIEKLKEQQAQGKTLEINQLAKLKMEEELLNELAQLKV